MDNSVLTPILYEKVFASLTICLLLRVPAPSSLWVAYVPVVLFPVPDGVADRNRPVSLVHHDVDTRRHQLTRIGIDPGSAGNATLLDDFALNIDEGMVSPLVRYLPDRATASAGVRKELPTGSAYIRVQNDILACSKNHRHFSK